MKTYIAFDAGCDIWEVELFDSSIDWHKEEFNGTFAEATFYADNKMHDIHGAYQPHYTDAQYCSIFDY